MKADNQSTGHNRTIRLTEIPRGKHGHLSELTIVVNYAEEPNDGQRLYKAITLDNVVIPAIIAAINGDAK